MSVVVLDANAVIMHGRAFPDRARAAVEEGRTLVLPRSVERELVGEVLSNDDAPENHRESALAIQGLIDDGVLTVREPNFERYGGLIDEARRRIADDSLPEHAVKADQYIPAIVCELAEDHETRLVTADRKLARTVHELAEREGVGEQVRVVEPPSVL